MTTTSPPIRHHKLALLAAPAALVGGGLWILHYALQIGYGLATGKSPMGTTDGSLAASLDVVAFLGAYHISGLALLGLYARLEGCVRWLGAAGALVALIPVLAASSPG